jgi:RNA-binding protein YhbY
LSENELSSLSGKLRGGLKSRAKTRPVDIRIGKKGVTENVLTELRKIFQKEDLVKVAFTQDRETRTTLLAEIEDKLVAVSIAVTGKTATLYKPLPSRK